MVAPAIVLGTRTDRPSVLPRARPTSSSIRRVSRISSVTRWALARSVPYLNRPGQRMKSYSQPSAS